MQGAGSGSSPCTGCWAVCCPAGVSGPCQGLCGVSYGSPGCGLWPVRESVLRWPGALPRWRPSFASYPAMLGAPGCVSRRSRSRHKALWGALP